MLNKSKLTRAAPELVIPFWLVSLYRKLFAIAFRNTVICVLVLFLHRGLRLLSFMMPLKVIVIAGSGNVPDFILHVGPNLQLIDVIFLLAGVAVACQLGAVRLLDYAGRLYERATEEIASRNNKVSNSLNIPSQILFNYEQIVKSLSGAFFIFAVVVFCSIINLTIALILIMAVISFWMVLLFSFKFGRPFQLDYFLTNRRNVQKWWALTAHIIVFISILSEQVFAKNGGGAIELIALFLLCRYAIAASNDFVSQVFRIFDRIDIVNSLFFFKPNEEVSLAARGNSAHPQFEMVQDIANSMLRESVPGGVRWSLVPNSASVYGVQCFNVYVETEHERHAGSEVFLLKIFEPRYQFLASHEKFLLQKPIAGLPAPKMLHYQQIESFDCFLLVGGLNPIRDHKAFSKACVFVLGKMWSIAMSEKAVQAFHRTHECDLKRLDFSKLSILSMYCEDEEDTRAFQFLERRWEFIKDYCLSLPLVVDNPQINMKTVFITDGDNHALCYQWGRWSVQPIGATLSHFNSIMEDAAILSIMETVKANRRDCEDLTVDDIALSGAYHSVLKYVEKQRFREALDAVRDVAARFEKIK